MHRTTSPLTRQSLPITGLGRIATSSNLSHKQTASLIQRWLAHILTLHPFSTAHLTIIEIPARGLVVRMVIFRQVTTLKSMIISCTPPNTTLIPTLMVPMGTTTSVDRPRALSGRRNDQMGKLANGFEFPLRCRQGSIPLSRFVLTSCLYHSTSVYNFFRGYLKALYHAAYQTLRNSMRRRRCAGNRPLESTPRA